MLRQERSRLNTIIIEIITRITISWWQEIFTLSDYPLLIGEILRRDQLRAVQLSKRRTLLYGLGKALGMRVARQLGNPVGYYSVDPAERVEE
jgi:hypothetical protein